MNARLLPRLILVLALALGACSNSTPRGGSAFPTPGGSVPNVLDLLPTTGVPIGTGVPTPRATGGAGSTPAPASTFPGASPSPPQFEWESTIPVEATVSPACVARGGTMTIVVRTEPRDAVAYHAVYAGTQGGAVTPYGHGHGGNDSGKANGEGVYRDSWVVGPSAPYGQARVDVVVGNGEAWGYDNPHFTVAGPSGC